MESLVQVLVTALLPLWAGAENAETALSRKSLLRMMEQGVQALEGSKRTLTAAELAAIKKGFNACLGSNGDRTARRGGY